MALAKQGGNAAPNSRGGEPRVGNNSGGAAPAGDVKQGVHTTGTGANNNKPR